MIDRAKKVGPDGCDYCISLISNALAGMIPEDIEED